MATIGSVLVTVYAKTEELRKSLEQSHKTISKWSKNAVKKFGDFAKQAADKIKDFGKVMAATFTGIFAAVTAIIASNSASIREMLNFSKAIDVGVESLQKWQAAAKTVGIESDQMNDILKDTADKIGDYLVTGGGAAADAFEKLNLNVEEFKNLNAGDALYKIAESMQNLTSKEQVFLMESLGNEASRLLPLFQNNAKGFQDAVNNAVASGNILTEQQVQSVSTFSTAVDQIKAQLSGFGKQLTVVLAEPFANAIQFINEYIQELGGLKVVATEFALILLSGIESTIAAINGLFKFFVKMKQFIVELHIAWLEFKNSLDQATEIPMPFQKEFKMLFGQSEDEKGTSVNQIANLRKKAGDLAEDRYLSDSKIDGFTDRFINRMRETLVENAKNQSVDVKLSMSENIRDFIRAEVNTNADEEARAVY